MENVSLFELSGLFDIKFNIYELGAPLEAQLVKNPPAMQETLVQFLGGEDPLEKGMANLSSILAWRIPWTLFFFKISDFFLWNILSITYNVLFCPVYDRLLHFTNYYIIYIIYIILYY